MSITPPTKSAPPGTTRREHSPPGPPRGRQHLRSARTHPRLRRRAKHDTATKIASRTRNA
eukprot:754539-Prymnesium_polylepis.1